MQRSLRTEGNGAVGGKKKTKNSSPHPRHYSVREYLGYLLFYKSQQSYEHCHRSAILSWWAGVTRWASSFSQLQGPFTPLTVYITPLESPLGLHTSPSMLGWHFLPGWNSTAPEAAKLTQNPGRLGISSGHILSALFCQAAAFLCI